MKKALQNKMLEIEQEIMMLETVEKTLLNESNTQILDLYDLSLILNPLRSEKKRLQKIQFMLMDIQETEPKEKQDLFNDFADILKPEAL